ncbi:sialic acid TRAP transporter substrate-binding protein SiaP (plasmid) [Limimaricola variabilis]|jgi:tripartite ATP-independent transporter DctP family solute receptor|uniref:sialic acid TRAP transporter substrate-binding protein SiaP n=1 Tax=Limimaricola variabilis TaxID=1492771 RepID=UPI002AC8B742|nr:sialic acid TRAP transporter substrate-binding protein SiaP [Limimaricola variabilis]WPY96421.1 sialic acid TRAP transporter substrate-binding protein SiaP [Limimaricola variabilis]
MIHTKMLAATAMLALIAGTAQARELTFGMQDNEVSNVFKGTQAFAEKLEELSGGELTVNLFPSGTLGDFKAMVAQVQAGELDMVITGYPDMSYVIPELKLVGAPYVVDDFAHLEEIVDGPWGQEMDAKFGEQGVEMLDLWYYGTRQTTANKPIESMEDMTGLRMRTPNVPFLIAYAENVGATPAPVAFQEVYLALQTNQVDAQENPLPTIDAMKFYEVQDHVAMTNHFVASAAILMSGDTWESLSEEEKGWVREAIEAGGEVSDEMTVKAEEDLIATFEERGLTITRPDLAPFRDAMQPYYDELEAEFGEGAIAKVRGE